MSKVSPSTLRKRAELVSLGYEQTEKPAADLVKASGEFAEGIIDLSPSAPGSASAVGLQLLAYYPPTREMFVISDRIISLTWNEAVGQAAVQGTLTIDNSDGSAALYLNRPGLALILRTRRRQADPFVERYRWVAWETEATDLYEAQVQISFYDYLIYIVNAECSVGYVPGGSHKGGWTAHEIAKDVLAKFKVPVGHLVATKHKIPYFVAGPTTIYDAIMMAYSIDRHQSGNEYFCVCEKGKVSVVRSSALYGLQGKKLNSKRHYVLAGGYNVRPGVRFSRSLDQYAAGILPSGGDAELVQGNIKGAKKGYVVPEGSREARENKKAQARLDAKEKKVAEQLFPEDQLLNTNPGATQPYQQRKGTYQQKVNSQLASSLLFGALEVQVGAHAIPNIGDPHYTRLAAQLLSDALARAQKKITVPCDGNILLRVGMIVYAELVFSKGRPLRKEIYIAGLSHSVERGEYVMQVTLAWRESEVSTQADYSQVESNALQSKEENEPVGAKNSGHGGTGVGLGATVTVQASEFAYSATGGAYGSAVLNGPGMKYAELGTATASGQGTGVGYLAKALGRPGELPVNFKIEIKYNGKYVFAYKGDKGFGSGNPFRAIDLYPHSGVCAALGFHGLGDVEVRPAQ